jgi:hypothetical protein
MGGGDQTAAHLLGQRSRQRQVHALAAWSAVAAGTAERLEQRLDRVRRQRTACVQDPQGEVGTVGSVVRLKRDGDHAACRAAAHGEMDQGREDFMQSAAIGGDADAGLLHGGVQDDVPLLRHRPGPVADLTQKHLGIDSLDRQGQAAALEAGEGRDLIDQIPQLRAGAEDLMHGVILPARQRLGAHVHPHQFGETDHRVQRRPELVTQTVKKARLRLAGLGEP